MILEKNFHGTRSWKLFYHQWGDPVLFIALTSFELDPGQIATSGVKNDRQPDWLSQTFGHRRLAWFGQLICKMVCLHSLVDGKGKIRMRNDVSLTSEQISLCQQSEHTFFQNGT